MVAVWAAAAVIFLIIEAVTAAMSSIWFVAGALAALLAALLGSAVWVQLILFAVVSGACLAILYPKLKNLLRRDRKATNADMAIGQKCVVTQRIDNLAGTGAVSVGGRIWTARTADGTTAEPGDIVVAQSIQGVKLIVSPAPEKTTASA